MGRPRRPKKTPARRRRWPGSLCAGITTGKAYILLDSNVFENLHEPKRMPRRPDRNLCVTQAPALGTPAYREGGGSESGRSPGGERRTAADGKGGFGPFRRKLRRRGRFRLDGRFRTHIGLGGNLANIAFVMAMPGIVPM